jgi:hypothetical protein
MKMKLMFFIVLFPFAGLASDRVQELKNFAAASNEKVKNFHTEATSTTCNSVTYQFPEEQLSPGEISYFHIPTEIRDRGVSFVIMGHRQNPEGGDPEWDESPGLTSFQVMAADKSWNYWNGQSSGHSGAKFAENSMYPEMENLYDWNKFGHTNTKTKRSSQNSLFPHAVKVLSMGKDPILLSEITVKVDPLKETSSSETIYSPGTSFSLDDHKNKYTLGGGQNFKGLFPKAHELRSGKILSIDLEAGKELTSINIACGDSLPDQKINKDGGWGSSGWAEISIGIKEASGSITWLTEYENVPPEGMIIASPLECGEKIKAGSKVIIRSTGSPLYIMGTHIGYK